jgi:hypothetical protein
VKAIVLLKRKPGLTHEQFRHHYETVHAQLAHKYLGHLFVEYRRNYPETREEDALQGVLSFLQSPYDAITELRFPNREAFEESQRIMADPVIGKIFADDEENFMDRSEFRVFTCDEVASDLNR